MVLTQKLIDEARAFLRASQAITDEFEHTVAELDEMRGSAYHRRKMDEATDERDTALARARARASEKIDPILDTLERRLDDMPLVPPTDEQLRALQLLSLRKNVSAGELQQCAQLCADCPAALELLRETAGERGMPLQLPAPKTLAPQAAREHLEAARRSIELLVYKPQDACWSPAFLLNDDDDHLLGRLCGVWAGRDGQLSSDYIHALRTALDVGIE